VEALLLDLAAQRTGFARETISPEARLLDDLNLDSIKAAELVAGAAKQVGAAGKLDPSKLANATLAEVAAAIRAVAGTAPVTPAPAPHTEGKVPPPLRIAADEGPTWVRDFAIEFIAEAA
jgi:acyl carrier protein